MRILVTGASGLVGYAAARAAIIAGHEVTPVIGQFADPLPGLPTPLRADLSNPEIVEQLIATQRPEGIINAAAIAKPAACKARPARAAQLNIELPGLLARLARETKARLIHLSTDMVFDGDHAPYQADDSRRPLSLYGRQKTAGEGEVLSAAPDHGIVVRLPLLLGNSPRGNQSVHEALLIAWAKGETARLFTDEIRQVAHADNVAAVLVELLGRPELLGVHHWAGAEPISRFALGERIRSALRLDPIAAPIEAITRADHAELAQGRPADLRLILDSLARVVTTPTQRVHEQTAALTIPPELADWVRQNQI